MPDLHPKILAAFNEIDAAIFSGDAFETKRHREKLKSYLKRWGRAVEEIEQRKEECGA